MWVFYMVLRLWICKDRNYLGHRFELNLWHINDRHLPPPAPDDWRIYVNPQLPVTEVMQGHQHKVSITRSQGWRSYIPGFRVRGVTWHAEIEVNIIVNIYLLVCLNQPTWLCQASLPLPHYSEIGHPFLRLIINGSHWLTMSLTVNHC